MQKKGGLKKFYTQCDIVLWRPRTYFIVLSSAFCSAVLPAT